MLAAWILAFFGNDSYLWMIIAILLIDAGMQSIHLANQTSVVALDASAINRINTVYMTIYFLGGSAGTFVRSVLAALRLDRCGGGRNCLYRGFLGRKLLQIPTT